MSATASPAWAATTVYLGGMTRSLAMSVRMADFARALRSETTSQLTLQHVVEAAVELIGSCEAAGIILAQRDGEVRTAAATDDLCLHSDKLQEQFSEGPCLDAVWQQHIVEVCDLREETRWPRWARAAQEELGVRSILSLRLFTHEDKVGALNLYSSEPHAWNAEDIEEATAIAAHAAVAVAASDSDEHLHNAMVNRTMIGQATGLVMAHYKLSSVRAFDVLRRLSSEQNRKLSLISREIVERWDETGSM